MRVMWLRIFLRRKYLLFAIFFGTFTLGIVYLVLSSHGSSMIRNILAWVIYDTQHCTDLEYEDAIAEVRELLPHTFTSNIL